MPKSAGSMVYVDIKISAILEQPKTCRTLSAPGKACARQASATRRQCQE